MTKSFHKDKIFLYPENDILCRQPETILEVYEWGIYCKESKHWPAGAGEIQLKHLASKEGLHS